MNQVEITQQALDVAAIQAELYRDNPSVGAVVTFIGLMRDMNLGQPVERMWLEHYPGMTEKALTQIIKEADARWELLGIRVVHRIGELSPQDPIVVVAAASEHRQEAFAACEFVIDYLKTRAPFWKKELNATGGQWVEARTSDDEAVQRWHKE